MLRPTRITAQAALLDPSSCSIYMFIRGVTEQTQGTRQHAAKRPRDELGENLPASSISEASWPNQKNKYKKKKKLGEESKNTDSTRARIIAADSLSHGCREEMRQQMCGRRVRIKRRSVLYGRSLSFSYAEEAAYSRHSPALASHSHGGSTQSAA